jgi:uncharacterized protein (DUF1015 family)
MVHIYPFTGLRPGPGRAQRIAAVPYDVVSADEARACIEENPESFLRVSRSDAELPNLPPYDEAVYQKARGTLSEMREHGVFLRDSRPSMYGYRVTHGHAVYSGLCCCLAVSDYQENRIRRHELTRYDKETDRTSHIDIVDAHTGPVVLLYQEGELGDLVDEVMAGRPPDTRVCDAAGAVHEIFVIDDPCLLEQLGAGFARVPVVYIADGHHRAKSAVNVAELRKSGGRYTDEAGRFMGVLFPHDRVRIHGYSRLITDLGMYTPGGFLKKVAESFSVCPYGEVDTSAFHIPAHVRPANQFHVVHMYLGGVWYECSTPVEPSRSLIDSLDVTVLQERVLTGILGITDPRGDTRLQYLGGARPLRDLEALVDRGGFAVAFSMQPVRVDVVLAIADAGGVMPPKSTWFEPKLLSGLVVHTIH